MKILFHLWLVVIVNMLIGCSPQQEVVIKFCESLNGDEHCETDRNHFTLGERVFVNLESKSPFKAGKIHGTIYRVTEDMKIPLSDKYFEIKPEQTSIAQNIPFHEFGHEAIGNFSIEFTDENEQIIAERELVISRE